MSRNSKDALLMARICCIWSPLRNKPFGISQSILRRGAIWSGVKFRQLSAALNPSSANYPLFGQGWSTFGDMRRNPSSAPDGATKTVIQRILLYGRSFKHWI
jgi:hypothetical protein